MNDVFRVIIAGGRDFNNYENLASAMDLYLTNQKKKIVIVCGMAKGADMLGERYAKERGYEIAYFPAEWNRYGRSAGMVRNIQMAYNADAVCAFWDGKSRGTKHMIDTAIERNLPVTIFRYENI